MAVSKNILLDSTGQDIIEGLDDIATAIVEHTPESIISDTTTSTSSTWSSYKINDELDGKLDVPASAGTNGQFLALDNNTTNWKNISDAIINDTGTSTSKVWSSNKVNTELSSINQAIVEQSAEIQLRATKAELKEANRRIHLLEESAVGKLYTQETVTETSYQQTVPSGSLSNAVLGGYCGKSVVWNQNLVIDRDKTQTAYGLEETIDQSAFTISLVGTPTSKSQFRAYLTTNDIPLVTGHKYFFNKNRLPANLGYRMQGAMGEITTGIFTAIDGQINDIVFIIKSLDPINVTFKPTLVDLTQMYGAGREPTETDVAIIAEIEAYALAHPAHNAGTIVSAEVNAIQTAKDGTVKQTVSIPSSVLSQYSLRSAGSVYDTITYEPTSVNGVTVPKWKHTQNVLKKVFDGTEDWVTVSGNAPYRLIADDWKANEANQNVPPDIICAEYESVPVNTSWSIYDKMISHDSVSQKVFKFRDTTVSSLDDFKAKLSQDPITVYYSAETPVVTDITELMQNWNGALEVEEGGTVTFKQVGDTIFAVPNTVNYLVKTTGGA